MITLGGVGYIHKTQWGSPGVVYGVEEEYGEEHRKKNQGTLFRQRGEYTIDPFLQECRYKSIER